MSQSATPTRNGHGWQLILADLALILFLLTLSALPAAEAETGQRLADHAAHKEDARAIRTTEIAAAQALYRPLADGPSLSDWLAAQQPDPRTTLTIFATHARGSEAAAWEQAQALATEARGSGAQVRTIITAGSEDDIYASLAYDAALAEAGEQTEEDKGSS